MEAGNRHFRGKYDLFTIYLVPGLTIFLASMGNWFDTNLSVLGNTGGRRGLLMLWGWLTGIYYYRYMLYLFQLGRYRGAAGRWLLAAAGIFIMTAVVIPYLPEQEPGEAALHVALAFFSPILLAAALVCDRRGGALPCLSCAGCRKAEGGIHPDIVRVGDDGKDISVAQVRALRADAYIRPNEAERKVYILENAQTMNASAQNAMLKLLEEGPAYAAFLLLTDNAAALLPTVRSRCEHLPLSPVTQREAELWLDEHYPDQPQAARQAAADRCEGLLGRAAAELEGQAAGDTQALDGALELVRRLDGGDELALLEHCVALEKWDREQLRALLDEGVLLLRDALVCSAGTLRESDPRRREAAERAARALSPRQLTQAVGVLERLRAACGSNVGAGHLAGWLGAALSTL